MRSRRIAILILAIVIYFTLVLCYKKFVVKDKYVDIYILKSDVTRGMVCSDNHFKKVSIEETINSEYITDISDIKNNVFKDNYLKNTFITSDMLIKKDEYIKSDKEVISIKLKDSEKAASYQIEKGSIVNVYYTAKSESIKDIINNIDKEKIISSNDKNSYITVKLLESVRIINTYDKYGNIVTYTKNDKSNITETIMIEVSSSEAIAINNLKDLGSFTVTILK